MSHVQLEAPSLTTTIANLEPQGGAGDKPLAVTQVRAAELLGLSDRTIRRWEARGLLKGQRVRGVKLYPYAQLESLAHGKVA